MSSELHEKTSNVSGLTARMPHCSLVQYAAVEDFLPPRASSYHPTSPASSHTTLLYKLQRYQTSYLHEPPPITQPLQHPPILHYYTSCSISILYNLCEPPPITQPLQHPPILHYYTSCSSSILPISASLLLSPNLSILYNSSVRRNSVKR